MSQVKPAPDFHSNLKDIEYELKHMQAIEQKQITGNEEITNEIIDLVNSTKLEGRYSEQIESVTKSGNEELASTLLDYLQSQNYDKKILSSLDSDPDDSMGNPMIDRVKELIGETIISSEQLYWKAKMKEWDKDMLK